MITFRFSAAMKIPGISFLLSLTISLAWIIFPSCNELNCIEGNNEMTRDNRKTEQSFIGVSLSADYSVFLRKSDKDSIVIEAESNLISKIITEVRNNTLELRTENNLCLNPRKPIIVRVYSNKIQHIDISGSGDVESDTLLSNQLKVTISGSGSLKAPMWVDHLQTTIAGSGNVELWGRAKNADFSISGSGNIESFGLDMDSCQTSISGSGNNYVFVRKELDASVSGSGSVYYKGNPDVKMHVSGSGTVENRPAGGSHALNHYGGLSTAPYRTLYLIY